MSKWNENDFREIIDEEETMKNNQGNDDNHQGSGQDKSKDGTGLSESEKKVESVEEQDSDKNYEDVCFMCRRPESKVGKMMHLPNNISVCNDCMNKTMESLGQMDYQQMFSDPNFLKALNMAMQTPTPSFIKQGDEEEKKEESDKKEDSGNKKQGFPNVSFINLADLQGMGGIPNKQKLKKKKSTEKPVLDINNIPAPHKIKKKLDDYVIGQEKAKKVISVAVYNHYKRVATNTMDEIEIEKSNMLMIGPTGSGKTYLVKTLAKLLDVPLAITDATSLTEAGYIGDDIESVVSKLLAAADNEVERAEQGIIFIDEIDKIAKKKNTNSRDVSGESVQQGMLKLLEGADVEVPVGASSKNAMVPLTTINTRNILFICGGAFPDLPEIIKQRLHKQTSIGFNAELKDTLDKQKNILDKVEVDDLKKFGMIPEFIGRLPIVYTLQGLTKDMLVDIMKEPKNAILKQYQKLLELDEVKLEFNEGALEAIAEKAIAKDTGARALRAIIEEFMLDIMYEIPKDDNIGRVIITKEYIEGTGGPIIDIRSNALGIEERDSLSEISKNREENDLK
ncbi:MAG: ATP-dependent Clp protease ATP-binding subunit ClpX [Eubacteriales bacterium]